MQTPISLRVGVSVAAGLMACFLMNSESQQSILHFSWQLRTVFLQHLNEHRVFIGLYALLVSYSIVSVIYHLNSSGIAYVCSLVLAYQSQRFFSSIVSFSFFMMCYSGSFLFLEFISMGSRRHRGAMYDKVVFYMTRALITMIMPILLRLCMLIYASFVYYDTFFQALFYFGQENFIALLLADVFLLGPTMKT